MVWKGPSHGDMTLRWRRAECEKSDEPTFSTDAEEGKSLLKDETTITSEKTPSPLKSHEESPRIAAADACRGIGIVLVVLYHMGYQLFMNAWIVISLFFSLSGFLITKNTIEAYERRGYVNITQFWAKRASRLFPCVLLVIITIILSQKMPFRHNDGATFQREATDLWYATIFLTNYNLVYLQPDDYFDEFSNPSVTRHLWTLSIEEQYYIIWPLAIWFLSKLVTYVQNYAKYETFSVEISATDTESPGSPGEESISLGKSEAKEEGADYKPYLLQNAKVKNLIRAVLLLDLSVMMVSYFSSWATINAMGLTAAYYSTWCRMGDIAAGGFAYSFSRLQPYVARRVYQDPTLEPLTSVERIICEIMSAVGTVIVIGLPMIQKPTEEMFVMYFSYLRLGISLTCFCLVATSIQLSEELPKWAIFTKFMNSKLTHLFGTVSYGAYIMHWPLLVYFGDPKGVHRHQLEEELTLDDDVTLLQFNMMNVFLFNLTFALAYVSFFYYEVPCMMKSRATAPWKTVMTGLSAMGVTLIIIWLVTKDLPPAITFENDFAAFNTNFTIEEKDPRVVWIMMVNDNPDISDIFWKEVLGLNIAREDRPLYGPQSDHSMRYMKNIHVLKEHHNQFARTDGNIFTQCKNDATTSPCNYEKLNNRSYWFWLESDLLCGNNTISDFVDFSKRCSDKFEIADITLTRPSSVDSFNISNRTELLIQMYEMLDGINDLYPGAMNQNFVSQYKQDYDNLLKPRDPIRITMIGESISMRIGMFWKDYLNINLPMLGYAPDDFEMPILKAVSNMGFPDHPAIAYWLCKSHDPSYQYDVCDYLDVRQSTIKVVGGFQSTTPNIVVIHDSGWAQNVWKRVGKLVGNKKVFRNNDRIFIMDRFCKILAFNIMASDALDNGADSIVYMTQSPMVGENKHERLASDKYFDEMNVLLDTLDILACSDDSFRQRRIKVNIVDWAKLVCPHIGDYTVCAKYNVHGFDDILPDGYHPYGDSGDWLSRVTLAIVLARYGMDHKYYTTLDEALDNPMSTQLLSLSLFDGNPPLADLLANFTICPYDDYKELEEDVNKQGAKSYMSYRVGTSVDNSVGDGVVTGVGLVPSPVGAKDGASEGELDGATEGEVDGATEGAVDGATEGEVNEATKGDANPPDLRYLCKSKDTPRKWHCFPVCAKRRNPVGRGRFPQCKVTGDKCMKGKGRCTVCDCNTMEYI